MNQSRSIKKQTMKVKHLLIETGLSFKNNLLLHEIITPVC
jgi:hypothetical protein